MTLNDPKPKFQGQAIFDAEYFQMAKDTAIVTIKGE